MAAATPVDSRARTDFWSREEASAASFPKLPDNDNELQALLANSSTDFLIPNPYKRLDWCNDENFCYDRILTFCTPEQARVLLSWMTSSSMLCLASTAMHSRNALEVMDQPKMISKFIQVVQDSRTTIWDPINVYDLLLRDQNSEARNPFYKGLPENVRKVLELEDQLHKFDFDRGQWNNQMSKDAAQTARTALIAKIDGEMGDFAKSLLRISKFIQVVQDKGTGYFKKMGVSALLHWHRDSDYSSPFHQQLREHIKKFFELEEQLSTFDVERGQQGDQILTDEEQTARNDLIAKIHREADFAKSLLLISKFTKVIEDNRTRCFQEIDVSALLHCDRDSDYTSPFHEQLRENIERILELEEQLHNFDVERAQRRDEMPTEEAHTARTAFIAKIDGEMGDFANSLLQLKEEQSKNNPEEPPAEISLRITALDLMRERSPLGAAGTTEDGKAEESKKQG